MLLLVTTSLRPVLTDLGLNEVFDSEMRVPPIASLQALEVVLKEVQLFSTSDARRRAVAMLAQGKLKDVRLPVSLPLYSLNISRLSPYWRKPFMRRQRRSR